MDWMNLTTGLVLGMLASTLFFAGLGLGLRVALRSVRPASVLLLSAGLRITLLLLVGWSVAQIGIWSLAGFAASFPIMRFASIVWARTAIVPE